MERTYTIPLRREWSKVPKYKRAKKAVTAIKEFLTKHMKATDVKVGKALNLELWKHGIRNPPPNIRVNCVKDKEGIVSTELFGKPMTTHADSAPKKKSMVDKVKAAVTTKDTKADVKTEKKPEAKVEQKITNKQADATPDAKNDHGKDHHPATGRTASKS